MAARRSKGTIQGEMVEPKFLERKGPRGTYSHFWMSPTGPSIPRRGVQPPRVFHYGKHHSPYDPGETQPAKSSTPPPPLLSPENWSDLSLYIGCSTQLNVGPPHPPKPVTHRGPDGSKPPTVFSCRKPLLLIPARSPNRTLDKSKYAPRGGSRELRETPSAKNFWNPQTAFSDPL